MFTLKSPLSKITAYTNRLKNFHKYHLHDNKCNEVQQLAYGSGNIKNDEITKIYLYGALTDPITFRDHSIQENFSWHDLQYEDTINLPIFKYEGASEFFLIDRYINSLPFINRLETENVDINDNTIERYLKFLHLKKCFPDENLVPTFDIDVVWHAHMLDHSCYVNDTKTYLGCVMDHNDDINKEESDKINFLKTEQLWRKTFGEEYVIHVNEDKEKSSNNIFQLPFGYPTDNITQFMLPVATKH